MYRYDFQVVSEALRLPTLKELVGYTPTQTESIAEFASTIAQSSTTFVDRTIDGNALQDEFIDRTLSGDEREILIKDFANRDESITEDGDARDSEDGGEKEIFDNDILGSEEIQRRSSSSSFVEGTPYPTSTTDRENVDPEKSIRRVEVPVRILDDANGEEIAELVILRLPESKLNSAILKPVFRVKVLEQDEKSRDDIARDGIESVSGSNEISSENELPDDRIASPRRRRVRVNSSSPTLGDTGKAPEDRADPGSRPRNRQRIVKARRRTRVQEVASSDSGEGASIPRENGQVLGGEENSGRRESLDAELLSATDGATVESTESSTAVRATTLRENVAAPSKAPSAIRGFYVTKSSIEASSTPDVVTTDSSIDSTRYPSASTGDYGTDETIEKTDFPTHSDETVTPFAEGASYVVDESSTYESIGSTVLEPEGETRISNDSLENVAPTVREKMETPTTDVISTSDDRFTETGPSVATMTEGETSEQPEVTTFRPWTTGEVQTAPPTTSAEATTTEYFTESSSEATEEESDPTTDHPSESLRTSENSRYGDSLNLVVKSTTVSATVEVDDNDGGTASDVQTERSARRSTTRDGRATTHKEPLKRGRVRFTTVSRSDTGKLSSPEHPRVSTKTSRGESDEKSRTSTETHEQTAEQGSVQTTGSLHASTLRSRDHRRRTTTSLSFDDSTTSSPPGKNNLDASSTEPYDPPVKYTSRMSSVETTGSPPTSRSFSRGKEHSRRTTKPFEIDTSTVTTTTTEAYDETGQYTTIAEAQKARTNFVEATGSPQLTSRSDDAWKTTETLQDSGDIAIDSTTRGDLTTTSTETSEETVEYASTTPEADYLSTNFVGTTGSLFYGRTLPEETGSVATTTESYDKITETSEPANTVYIADNREEEVRTETTLSIETTSNLAETTRPWSYLQRNRVTGSASIGNAESIDISNDVTLDLKTDTFPPTTQVYPITDRTELKTPAEDSGTKVNDEYGISTKSLDQIAETMTSPESETTLQFFSATTPVSTIHDISGATTTTIPSQTKTDNIVEASAEESSSTYRGVVDEKSTTESSGGRKVYSTVDSTRNTIAPVAEHRETKRVRGRVRFTNFAAHPDETGRNRRPVKQVVVRRRPVTESNNRHRIVDASSERSTENETLKNSRHPNGQSAEETKNSVELHERFDEKEDSTGPSVRLFGKNRSTSLSERSTEKKEDKKESARVNGRSAEAKKKSASPNDRSAEEKKYSSRVNDRLAGKKYSSRANDRSAERKNSADANDRSAEEKKYSSRVNDRSAQKKNSADPNDRSAEEKKYSLKVNDRSAERKNSADPNDRSAEEKTYPSRVNGRLADDKKNRTKSLRRRVIVYRGRPRPEIVTSTTTMQSLRASSDEIPDEGGRKRRRMWRKRVVLKRERTEEADDQSIAETVDFRRAMIDASLADFRDLGSSIEDPELASSAEQADEDNGGEANPYKSSGGFLRRPGSLVRGQGNNRPKTKTPGNSDSIILPVGQPPVFSKIQPVVVAQEIKTDDQSGRAQELAVTLADPPGVSSATTGRLPFRTSSAPRKISTTIAPRTEAPATSRTTPLVRRRQRPRGSSSNERIVENVTVRPRRPAIIDYDYYVDDDDVRLVVKPELKDKLFVTRKGGIRCLDQGNFAHPTSCKKFITCARMVNGQVIGTEYTCPDKLSFDPVGGICNWSAGLGCEDNKKP